MEYLDIYDAEGNYLGKELRSVVHQNALWHKTVHCWLYDKQGNVFFQIRKDSHTLYTTASGHLMASESIEQGFQREIKEELGILVDASDADFVMMNRFVMDKKRLDGSMFRDRAFANVYIDLYEGNYKDFAFDTEEVLGIAIVSAKDALSLFQKGSGSISGTLINASNEKEEKVFEIADFLVNEGETLLEKYGEILKKVISKTS